MALQLILGNAGAGKSRKLYEELIQESLEHPRNQYLVLVPEQSTMQTQKELVQLHPAKGLLNVDVLSFKRLAYRIFQEAGGQMRPLLEETGKSLVVQRVAQEQKGNLGFLGSQMKKQGYIHEMKSLISELQQYEVEPEMLGQLEELAQKKPLLQQKLADVQVIYRAYREFLSQRFMTGEEVLDAAARRAKESGYLGGVSVLLDGFTGFTPVQHGLLVELLRLCPKVTVILTLDDREDPYRRQGPHKLFSLTLETIHTLIRLAREAGTEILPERWIKGGPGRFSQAPSLAFLERQLFRYGRAAWKEAPGEIHLWAAANPLAEMREIARKIRELVRVRGWRYRDVAVVTADPETYKSWVSRAFEECGIPYFQDEKHAVLLNPFVEYIRAAVDMVVQNFRYPAVFRYLRCGLSGLAEEETDALENYVIALGIQGLNQWREHWVRRYRGLEEAQVEEINKIREKFLGTVEEFAVNLKKKNNTVEDYTRILYEFLKKGQLERQLALREQEFAQAGEAGLAREYAQIYGIVMELFDKLAGILGEEQLTLTEYQQLLEAGLSEAQVGIIPPQVDQVLVGDMERTRLGEIKALFFAGMNEGLIPRQAGRGGILSEGDREFLKDGPAALAPTAREQLYTQRFYLYLSLTRPSRELYLTYARSTAGGEALLPAYLVDTIRQLFPRLTVRRLLEAGEPESPADEPKREGQKPERPAGEPESAGQESESPAGEPKREGQEPEHPAQELETLVSGLRRAAEGEADDQWKELFAWYLRSPQYESLARRMAQAAFLEKPQDHLGRQVAQALYGKTLVNSATRLEKFAACAFAHFLQYGLQLQERQVYEFKAADMGNVMHQSLERFALHLREEGLRWRDLEPEKREELAERSVEEIIHDYGNTVLHSTARREYQIRRIKRILKRTVWALQEQLRCGDFEPGGFEISFSMEEDLRAVNFALTPEERLKLTGRIDRVDICQEKERVLVKVIDYKSGNNSLDLVALYHGLQLQLVVYLNAALELSEREYPGKEAVPAGIFYYRMQDPMMSGQEQEGEEELKQRILKELRVNGLVSSDPEIIGRLDRQLAGQTGSSQVIPVSYNKDQSLSKTSSAVSREKFAALSRFVERKLRELGGRILEGEAELNPYQLKEKKACTFCPYQGVCGFDERIPGFSLRRLRSYEDQELWQALDQEV